MESRERIEELLTELLQAACKPDQAAKVLDFAIEIIVRKHHRTIFWGDRMLLLDRSAEFLSDSRFKVALSAADSSTGANQYKSPDGISWRYNTLVWAAIICLKVPGDYVECGTYRGDMAWMISELVDLAGFGKKLYLYDTFSGLDPRYSSPADFGDSPQFFEFLNKEYSAPMIEESVRARFRRRENIIIIKGTVPDILNSEAPDCLAFLHLDLNSPKAEVGALEVLFDRISIGGVVVFDDYGWKEFSKQKETADRFARTHSQSILELPTGQGLMIKRPY